MCMLRRLTRNLQEQWRHNFANRSSSLHANIEVSIKTKEVPNPPLQTIKRLSTIDGKARSKAPNKAKIFTVYDAIILSLSQQPSFYPSDSLHLRQQPAATCTGQQLIQKIHTVRLTSPVKGVRVVGSQDCDELPQQEQGNTGVVRSGNRRGYLKCSPLCSSNKNPAIADGVSSISGRRGLDQDNTNSKSLPCFSNHGFCMAFSSTREHQAPQRKP